MNIQIKIQRLKLERVRVKSKDHQYNIIHYYLSKQVHWQQVSWANLGTQIKSEYKYFNT